MYFVPVCQYNLASIWEYCLRLSLQRQSAQLEVVYMFPANWVLIKINMHKIHVQTLFYYMTIDKSKRCELTIFEVLLLIRKVLRRHDFNMYYIQYSQVVVWDSAMETFPPMEIGTYPALYLQLGPLVP